LEQVLHLIAPDGYVLGATLYGAAPSAETRRAAVLCCGGGVPARVYRRFACWLAAHDIPVLTFDYRGIGRSRPVRLRGFDASLEDWAEQDCAAAIAWLRSSYPHAELIGIAHSVGCIVLASAPNAGQLSRFLLVGAHTGYFGDYHPRWRWLMTMTWHRLMPALARLFGYFPGRALRLGEDLPAGIALQWAGRRTPQVNAAEPRAASCLARGRGLRGRALVLSFTDDGFATARGTRRVLQQHLPGIAAEERMVAPRDASLKRIGHFGFFRQSAEHALWPPIAAWLATK
jgi:predicted alpha/beta hydrolase